MHYDNKKLKIAFYIADNAQYISWSSRLVHYAEQLFILIEQSLDYQVQFVSYHRFQLRTIPIGSYDRI